MALSRFEGKVCIVTGAGQGIGRATATRLASEGAQAIVVADVVEEGARRVVDELQAQGTSALAFVGDLCDYATAKRLITRCVETHGKVDVLVNNVGGARQLKPFWTYTEEEIQEELKMSTLPPVWCTHAVIPAMMGQKYGRIVNVGSSAAAFGQWDRAPYVFAKGGVHAFTLAIARELAPYGIACNAVAPGTTDTTGDRLVNRLGKPSPRMFDPDTDEGRRIVAENSKRGMGLVPLARASSPEEQAAAIAFLASDDASYITGQVLSVNGGIAMSLH